MTIEEEIKKLILESCSLNRIEEYTMLESDIDILTDDIIKVLDRLYKQGFKDGNQRDLTI